MSTCALSRLKTTSSPCDVLQCNATLFWRGQHIVGVTERVQGVGGWGLRVADGGWPRQHANELKKSISVPPYTKNVSNHRETRAKYIAALH